jgi:hypothetical protein
VPVLIVAILAATVIVILGWTRVPAATGAFPPTLVSPVYGLPQVRRELDRDPRAWLGRTLRVQGTLVPDTAWTCSHVAACADVPLSFVLPGATGRTTHLPVRWEPAAPLVSALRRLPLVGRLLPSPQGSTWGAPAIYCVQIQHIRGRRPINAYQIVVLDASPPRWSR